MWFAGFVADNGRLQHHLNIRPLPISRREPFGNFKTRGICETLGSTFRPETPNSSNSDEHTARGRVEDARNQRVIGKRTIRVRRIGG
jgi:hypothetical protein